MNEAQEEHLEYIQDELHDRLDHKFRKGAEEHGTQLHEDHSALGLVEFAMEEATDLPVYILTLQTKIIDAVTILEESSCDNCKAALELLR